MTKGRVLSGRLRAYGYGLATTAIVICFALAERGVENFVSDRSRVASTTIQIAIVLLAALAFRPLHRRVEQLLEAAFTKKRREARDAVARLRKELTSFNDVQQVLRRVVEAVDHSMGASGSAIYLRHGSYDVEASTFDAAVRRVEPDDALVVRLRSSAAPVDPRALRSAAIGDLAFPMMAGGELVGFLTMTPKHVELDAEDRHALATFVEAAGVALVALDSRLRSPEARKRETRPNNLPRAATSFVGRVAEVVAVAELVRNNPLVTICGAGGMGKTRLALQVAQELLSEKAEGAWFVDLAPIGDGALVPSAILSTLGVDQTGDDNPVERAIEHLAARSLLLLLDNSEHLIRDIARVADAIVASCPDVCILATSREPLGVNGEVVHRVASLDAESSLQLFAERARAVNDRFELNEKTRSAVLAICGHLDGMALAIELAAARVRSLSVEEISRRLQLRMLGGVGRDPVARHQTMYALIDWSYDLLLKQEQDLFVQLSPFVGGITLDSAMSAYCCDNLGEWELLDIITSLVDKSLLVADVEESTQRYRFLEPIRAYARERLQQGGDEHNALRRFAQTFADFSDRAYHEFDTGPQADWLERCRRELDNVRAAMRWALEDAGRRDLAVTMAGAYGAAFLRLTLLQEGIDWCRRAISAQGAPVSTALEARLQYVLSMLCNNQARYSDALAAAQCALALFRSTGDRRGIARALSQVAQQLENNGRPDEAAAMAEEAVEEARQLDDRAVLASVLGRAGNALAANDIDKARSRYTEALALYSDLGRNADRARVMSWWANGEYTTGNFAAAASLIEEALIYAQDDLRTVLSAEAVGVYWALKDRERAVPATRQAVSLAAQSHSIVHLSDTLMYAAMLAAEKDSQDAARLFGYAEHCRREFGDPGLARERELWDQAQSALRDRLGSDRFETLLAEGASWSDDRAAAVALAF